MKQSQNPIGARPVEILLVEDSAGDVRLTQEAFRQGKIRNTLHVVRDGVEALAFLHGEGTHAEAPHPDLILLDLNLPKKDGRDVLKVVKNDAKLRRIPVIVMTVSGAEEDILKSYDLNANCYIQKPVDMDEFMRVVRSIEDFWLTIALLPPDGDR